MLHFFKSVAARTLTYSLIAVVTLGLMIGVVRLALPFADLFRTQIAQALGETLDLDVRMGRFEIRLAGMVPRVTLEDVDLLDPQTGEPQLELMRLHLDLDLTASLKELAPQVESLTLEGARLLVKRQPSGTIAVAGLKSVKGGDPGTMDFFLANGRFLLIGSDLIFRDELTGAPPIRLSDVQIRFDNEASHHRMGLRARLAESPDTRLHLAADLHGEPNAPTDWSGDLYLDLRGSDLPGPTPRGTTTEYGLRSEHLRVQSWNRISGSHIAHSLNLIALEGLEAGRLPEDGDARLRAQRLDALVLWAPQGDGWSLDASDLTLAWTPTQSSILDLRIRYRRDLAGGWTISAGVEGLTLADLRPFLELSPNVFPLLTKLRNAEPTGDLRGLRLRLEQQPNAPLQWTLGGRLAGLKLVAQQPIPGVSGLDVGFQVGPDGGRLDLDGKDLHLELPWLFGDRGPLQFEQLSGPLTWERLADDGLRLASEGLRAENADLCSHTRFSLDLPANRHNPNLSLHSEIRDLKANAIRRYLPVAKLKPKPRIWLDQAFQSGEVPWVGILFEGNPADFPFRNGEGRLAATIRTQDLELRFHPDWPHLEAVQGVVQLENTRLDIDVSDGRIRDLAIIEAQGLIPDLSDVTAIKIKGATIGPFASGLTFLRETPIKKRLGPLAALFRAEGTSRVDLDMSIPLRKRGPENRLELSGTLSWPDPATLALSGADMELKALSGALSFDRSGVTRSRLEAELWGGPLTADLDGIRNATSGTGATSIKLSGTTSVRTLEKRLPSPLWRHLGGKSAWTLDLKLPHQGLDGTSIPLELVLATDLYGMELDLPAPLGKDRAESRPLQLEGSLRPGEDTRIHGHYAEHSFSLTLTEDTKGRRGLARGEVAFGTAQAPLPEREGLHISGRLAEVDLPAWMDLIKDATNQGSAGVLRSADLHLDRLLLPGSTLHDLHLKLAHSPGAWNAQIKSAELTGQVTIPHRPRSQPLRITLEQLDLKPLLADWETDSPRSKDPRDPRRSHTLDLSVERLRWGAEDLGRLRLSAEARDDGLAFNEIRLDAEPLMQISGGGHWRIDEQGPNSGIDLQAEGKDLGEFLRRLDYRSHLDKTPVRANCQLNWPGGPSDFALAALSGQALGEIGPGSLLDVDPGVGRMLGVFNLDTLKRRLSLDFSDLFNRGFAFERMVGELDIHDGQARIEDMRIEAPSANIRIEGKTDLVKREFAQVVTITPDLGTGVALASAVAGGPLVGAAVLIADKVSGGAVDKIGRFQYEVTGPWDAPKMKRRPHADTNTIEKPFLSENGRADARRASEKESQKAVSEPHPRSQPATPERPEPEASPFLEQ